MFSYLLVSTAALELTGKENRYISEFTAVLEEVVEEELAFKARGRVTPCSNIV